MEYRSGAFYPSELKKLPLFKLQDLYRGMLKDRLAYGEYVECKSFTSVDQALAHCARLHSSIVACKESERIISQEENEVQSEPCILPTKEQKKVVRTAKMKFPPDAVITVLVDKNPKKRTAAERFNLYRSGMTVQELLEISSDQNQAMNDIAWDMDHGWIRVEIPNEYSEAV